MLGTQVSCPSLSLDPSTYTIYAVSRIDDEQPVFAGAPTYQLQAATDQALIFASSTLPASLNVRVIETAVEIGCGCGGASAVGITNGGLASQLTKSTGSISTLL